MWRAVRRDAKVKAIGSHEHPIGVFEAAFFDPIEPDDKGLSESRARLGGRADEIGDHRPAGLNHAIAHPAHAPRVLDTVLVAETEVARQVGAHGVSVEHNGIQERRQCVGERGLAGGRQAHNENFPFHLIPAE